MLYLGDACVVSVVVDQLRFVKTSIEEKVGHSPLLVLSQCKGRDYIAYSHSTQPSTATSEKREQPLALNLRSVLASKCAGGTHTHLCQCTAACWTCHPQYQRMCTRSTAKMSSNPLSHRPASSRSFMLNRGSVSHNFCHTPGARMVCSAFHPIWAVVR